MSGRVQLANQYKGFPAGYKHVFVEPKLDGYRLAAFIKGNRVVFETRQGNKEPFTTNLAFIGEQLLRMGFGDGIMVDGEIIVTDWNSTGLIKRKNMSPADRAKLESTAVFWVFDVVDGNTRWTLEERRANLVRKIGRGSKNVKTAPQYKASSDAEVQKLFRDALAGGYEGVIVKIPGSLYERRRSNSWLKIKDHKTFDVRITGREEGTGRLKGSLGALVGVLRNGAKVKLGTGLTDAQRAKLWRLPLKQLVGKWAEAKAQNSGVADARHPVFVRWREDINVDAEKPMKRKTTRRAIAKITDAEIRRKYESCVLKVKKGKSKAGAYGICASTLHKTYGKKRVETALASVRKKAAKDAAKTRAKNAKKGKRKNPSQKWPLRMMFGSLFNHSGKKALEAAEKHGIEDFELNIGVDVVLHLWFSDSRSSGDADVQRYMKHSRPDDRWYVASPRERGSSFTVELPTNLVCESFQMQMILPSLVATEAIITSDRMDIGVQWDDRIEALSPYIVKNLSVPGGIQTYRTGLRRVE